MLLQDQLLNQCYHGSHAVAHRLLVSCRGIPNKANISHVHDWLFSVSIWSVTPLVVEHILQGDLNTHGVSQVPL